MKYWSLQSPASVIGDVSSRLWSVFRKQNKKGHKIRRNRPTNAKPSLRLLADPTFMEDRNFYMPDCVKQMVGNEHQFKAPKQKMPKIYITKLPGVKIGKEP